MAPTFIWFRGSVSDPDPHSMGYWKRIQKGKISPNKEEK
jgi:hypothetical protein